MSRRIRGLVQARRCQNPWPKSRPTTKARAAGLAYERLVGRALPRAEHNPWFEFADAQGPGHCSPDFLINMGDYWLVVECKLTYTPQAWVQLRGLYLPVLAMALGAMPIPVSLAKNVTRGTRNVVGTLAEAKERWLESPTMQWLGHGDFPWA